jgi:hypothetical protein
LPGFVGVDVVDVEVVVVELVIVVVEVVIVVEYSYAAADEGPRWFDVAYPRPPRPIVASKRTTPANTVIAIRRLTAPPSGRTPRQRLTTHAESRIPRMT